jgi:predicted O-methyltransferase YrrM
MITDKAIISLIDELETLARTRKDAWQIPRVEGELLYQIALFGGATMIVEVGTSYGFSGLFWGAALKRTGGHLHTIDIDPAKYDSSKLTFAKAGLNEIITNHLGNAREILPILPGPVDIAFIDADKPPTEDYFRLLWPKIRAGGSVLIDNATTHRKELAGVIHMVRSLPDASSAEVAIGNGVEWTIKLP